MTSEEYKINKRKLSNVFRSIKNRCYDPKNISYKKYGAKNIGVCKEWLLFPENFYEWAFKNGYKYIPDKNGRNVLSIDRIDGTKGYCPENCRWVTQKIQSYNRKNTHLIEYNGELKTLNDLCNELGLPYGTVYRRIKYYGISFDDAISISDYRFKNKTNKSGHRYIYKMGNKFCVQIDKKYYGCYNQIEDAITQRDKILEENHNNILKECGE